MRAVAALAVACRLEGAGARASAASAAAVETLRNEPDRHGRSAPLELSWRRR